MVTLVTREEMEYLKVRDLGEGVRSRKMDWWHLPIPDGHAPDEHFEARWVEAGAAIRNHLRSGRDVLVHCKGGLGRAGTIAARLMVELGTPPEDAIRLVRESRSDRAIETPEQEAHVQGCRALGSDSADATTSAASPHSRANCRSTADSVARPQLIPLQTGDQDNGVGVIPVGAPGP